MKNTLKIIIFFGTDSESLIALQALYSSGYNIAAVVTKPDSKQGRGQKLTASCVKNFAIEHNITVWQPQKVSDINKNFLGLDQPVAGVLVSYGKIIPQSTIILFKPGIINVHPSLLPTYRGPSPIESAIANGDSVTGVSIMKLSAGIDNGPVYKQVIHELNGQESRPELYETLFKAGTDTLLSLLPSILNDLIQATPQDETKATYCNLFTKDDSWIKPNEISSKQAEQLVRAHLDFPKTKIEVLGHIITITKAHVSIENKSPLDILCNDNNYLSIDEIVAPSGRTMSAKDFLNGYN